MTGGLTGRRIAILGAGLIGASWVALFQYYGASVAVWDPKPAARASLRERLDKFLLDLEAVRPVPYARTEVVVTAELGKALSGAELVQESAPEDYAVKCDLYRKIEKHIENSTIIASSTSALTWSDLAPVMSNPNRLITAHPFNPLHLIPLVEIFGREAECVIRAEEIYRAADRVPIRLNKDVAGHIANRLASALWREAVHIVAEGIADLESVDSALVNGPGLRWSVIGAHLGYHLGGGPGGLAAYLEHLGPSQERRWSDLGTPSLTPEVRAALIEGIEAYSDCRNINELEQARDAALVSVLKARRLCLNSETRSSSGVKRNS